MSVAAIILAAGLGRRFGPSPKLLADWRGKPLVRHVAEAALASQAKPALAVTGHQAEHVEQALSGLAVRFVPNPAYADGLSTSLKAGFAALPPEAEAAIVLLGDMPLVDAPLIDRLIGRWRETRATAVVPVGVGRRGNPVVLSRGVSDKIALLSGDRGAGPLLLGLPGVVEEQIDGLAAFSDIDTPDALAALAGQEA